MQSGVDWSKYTILILPLFLPNFYAYLYFYEGLEWSCSKTLPHLQNDIFIFFQSYFR